MEVLGPIILGILNVICLIAAEWSLCQYPHDQLTGLLNGIFFWLTAIVGVFLLFALAVAVFMGNGTALAVFALETLAFLVFYAIRMRQDSKLS